MPRVEVAANKKGFVLAGTTTPFRPWGLNYGNSGRLIEDFWADDWPTVEAEESQQRALNDRARKQLVETNTSRTNDVCLNDWAGAVPPATSEQR